MDFAVARCNYMVHAFGNPGAVTNVGLAVGAESGVKKPERHWVCLENLCITTKYRSELLKIECSIPAYGASKDTSRVHNLNCGVENVAHLDHGLRR
jgi:hypothetical protein